MIRNYFWIDYDPHDQWVLSIMSRIQRSESAVLQKRWQESAQSSLTELPLALTTKFQIMQVTRDRLNVHIRELSRDFDERPDEVRRHIAGLDGEKTAYRPQNPRLAFEIVADLDAWIFEFRSTYEILYAFVKEFSSRILDRTVNNERVLKAILRRSAGVRARATSRPVPMVGSLRAAIGFPSGNA